MHINENGHMALTFGTALMTLALVQCKAIQWRIYEGARDAPPQGSKFFQFHAVFGKFWQNLMFAPTLQLWRPHLGEFLAPPLQLIKNVIEMCPE